MIYCSRYVAARAAFLVATACLLLTLSTPSVLAQERDLTPEELAHLQSQPFVLLDNQGRALPGNDARLKPGTYQKGEVIVRFVPGVIDLPGEVKRAALPQQAAEKATLVKSAAARSAFEQLNVRALRRVFDGARPDVRETVETDSGQVVLPDLSQIYVIELPLEADVEAAIAALGKLPGVLYAEPNVLFRLEGALPLAYAERLPTSILQMPSASPVSPADPRYAQQWGLEQANDKDIDAEGAWDIQHASLATKIAILDSGIDYTNPDLGGTMGSSAKVYGGYDYVNSDSDPRDDNFHGTHVAGIAAALTNNFNASGQREGIAGVAGGWDYNAQNGSGNKGAQLVALKFLASNGFGSSANAANAIHAASGSGSLGSAILNNSWGCLGSGCRSETIRGAIDYATRNGRVFVAAKGNEDSTERNYPSDYDGDWVISVGAVRSDGLRAISPDPGWGFSGGGSNMGNGIDVVAPGTAIVSTMPTYTTGLMSSKGWPTHYAGTGAFGQGEAISGTSMAAPHVSGIAALLRAEFAQQNLSWHHQVAEGIIKATAVDDNFIAGYDDEYGHGLVNAEAALKRMRAPYVLQRLYATGGTTIATANISTFVMLGSTGATQPGANLSAGTYSAVRHTVEKTVAITGFTGTPDVFCRGVNGAKGWSAANYNYGTGFCEVVSSSASSVTLRTYVYKIYNQIGQYLGWYPTTPEGVIYQYTINGIPYVSPFVATISGPGSLGYKQSGQWTASYSGGTSSGTPTYHWYSRNVGSSTWIDTYFYGQTYTQTMFSSSFELRVDVTRGTDTATDYHTVYYDDGGALRATSPDALPEVFALHGAAPNPAHDVTDIHFDLPEEAHVRVVVYDVMGREVARIVDETRQAGAHTARFEASALPSGVYLVRMTAAGASGPFQQTQRLTLVR